MDRLFTDQGHYTAKANDMEDKIRCDLMPHFETCANPREVLALVILTATECCTGAMIDRRRITRRQKDQPK